MTDTFLHRFHPLRLTAVVAALALLATACGDAGDSADATTTPEVSTVTSQDGPSQDADELTTTSVAPAGDDETADGEAEPVAPSPGSLAPVDEPGLSPVSSGDLSRDLAGPVDESLTSLVNQAIDDLAGRLGVSTADVATLRAEMVVWPDSSRGCPQPGMEYLQVLSDGTWIVLSHDGATYEYHTDRTGAVSLCESAVKQRPVEGATPGFGSS